MADGKLETIDAAHQVIVLAFDLADAEVQRLPNQVIVALQSPLVQASIKKTLLDFASTKSKTGNTVVSDDEAAKLVASLGSGIKDAGSQELIAQIRKTPEFRRLEASVDAFKKAAESSTLGVWVDRNKKLLYVVGAALVVGTAGVLYVTKTGGQLVNTAVDPLKGREFEVLQIGHLTLKAGLWDFRPDARVLGARVFATTEWEKVTVDLKLGVLAEGTQIQQAEGEAVVKSKGFSVSVMGTAKPVVQQVNLGLKFGYDGRVGNGKFNIAVGAMYQDEQLSGTVGASYKLKDMTFGLEGKAGPQKGGGVQYGGLLTMTIPIN
jgi:hypothetical protein